MKKIALLLISSVVAIICLTALAALSVYTNVNIPRFFLALIAYLVGLYLYRYLKSKYLKGK